MTKQMNVEFAIRKKKLPLDERNSY
jgi:hypothetical protein